MQRLHELNNSKIMNTRQDIEQPNPRAVKACMALFKKNKGMIEALLMQSLHKNELNYITAAYFLIKKHEL